MQKSTIVALGLALSVLNLTAQSFFESFDAPGTLASDFNVFQNATPPAGSPFLQVSTGGVGNSGGVSVSGATNVTADATMIQKNTVFDFSKVGVTLTISAMINVSAQTSTGNKILQLGFVNANTNGLNSNDGTAFTSLRLLSTAASGNVYASQYQTKVAAGTTSVTSANLANNISLLVGEWYEVSGSFINLGGGQILAKGFVQDFGTSGVFPESVIYTFPTTVLTSADIAADSSVYAALRGFNSDGLHTVDNLTAVMVVPEPGTFSLVLLGLAGFAARAWKRKS